MKLTITEGAAVGTYNLLIERKDGGAGYEAPRKYIQKENQKF